ncbi:hypothetical protein GN956_G26404, partial [Arapaima gigas]
LVASIVFLSLGIVASFFCLLLDGVFILLNVPRVHSVGLFVHQISPVLNWAANICQDVIEKQ